MSVVKVTRAGRRPASSGRGNEARRAPWDWRLEGVVQGEEERRLWREVGRVARRAALKLVVQNRFPRCVVDDVVQETLIAVFQILPVWDRSRPLKTWVITVARNKTIDAMREARWRRRRPLDDIGDMPAPSAATAAECRLDVARLMARLSPRGREIVLALALQGEGVEEVAARLSLSHVAVRVALHRAIRQMGQGPGKAGRGNSGAA